MMTTAIYNKIIHLKDMTEYYIFQERYPLLNYFNRKFGKGKNAKGVVLMLHRVSERTDGHLPNNEHLKVSTKFLEKVILNPQIESIYKYAFFGCSNLTSINVPKETKTFEETFMDCDKLNLQ